eukprot:1721836-Alexandrium_andersonii.AAC.1
MPARRARSCRRSRAGASPGATLPSALNRALSQHTQLNDAVRAAPEGPQWRVFSGSSRFQRDPA